MRFLIPANHVKYFAKTIHCLCRLGSEIYLDCGEDSLQVNTLNASRSTFASFVFPQSFFEKFDPVIENEEENPYLVCKISVKTFLQVFRSLTFIERSVETCEIHLSDNMDQLIFTLNCRHAVVKTFQLNFEECESLKALYTKDLSPNKLHASSKFLQEVLCNFPTSLDELSLSVTPCKVTLSSFADQDEVGKVMSTEMNLDPKEFVYFQVGVDSCISFCLKDLRSILNFAESCGTDCKMSFEYGGKPLVVELVLENIFSSNFVLATIAGDTQSQQASNSVVNDTTTYHNDLTRINNTKNTKSKAANPRKEKMAQKKSGFTKRQIAPEKNPVVQEQHGQGDHVKNAVRITDILFSDVELSQRKNKIILAADSDDET